MEPRHLNPINPVVGSVSAFFPCYNDAPTIGAMVRAAAEALESVEVDYEVIVVDDGSADDSVAVLTALRREVPALRVVEHGTNRGYGGALRSGFAAATKEWVFYTDGDGQYDPSELVDLVKEADENVDWVQGWKIERGDSWVRKVVGRTYHHTVRLLFRLPVRDTDCDFRLIRRSLLDRVTLTSNSGTICAEMMYRFTRAGGRVVEVPVHHYDRPFGVSQFFTLPRVVKSARELLKLWWRLGHQRPEPVAEV